MKEGKRRVDRGQWRGVAVGLLTLMLLGAYTWRTIDRNWDWEDEERLFRAALKACTLILCLLFRQRQRVQVTLTA